MTSFEAVIGLEVHAQLATESKIFSNAPTAYGASPNAQANIIDLGFPGTLPVLNQRAVDMAIAFGLAIDAQINLHSTFDRKNYFYPDLPKGYQISQFERPIVGEGHLDILLSDGQSKRIHIKRAHLEEDAGKSLHEDFQGFTGIDLNRAGTPLLEVVSEPDFRSAEEAVAYLKALHTLVRHLKICDGNMQEGSFRCDVNVSVRPVGQIALGTRTECKNINSFRFVERAIHYEIERQIMVIESGHAVIQETRLFDPDKNETRPMRGKEDAHDYRYFPDPDLPTLVITEDQIANIKASLPELPQAMFQRFQRDYGLNATEAGILVTDMAMAQFFEATTQICQAPKLTTNWIINNLTSQCRRDNISLEQAPITPKQLAQLLQRLQDNTISGKMAKDIFEALWQGEFASADEMIAVKGLKQMDDSGALAALIDKLIADNPAQVAQLKAGKTKILGFFVGQVMKATQGKANPEQVNRLLMEKIKSADCRQKPTSTDLA